MVRKNKYTRHKTNQSRRLIPTPEEVEESRNLVEEIRRTVRLKEIDRTPEEDTTEAEVSPTD